MIHKITDLTEALAKAMEMPWAYIAYYSFLHLGVTPKTVDWKQVLDARFFGPEGELRLFRQDDVLTAVWVDDTPHPGELDTIIDKVVPLRSSFGKKLHMKQHIVFDEDGQACIYTTRLSKWTGGV